MYKIAMSKQSRFFLVSFCLFFFILTYLFNQINPLKTFIYILFVVSTMSAYFLDSGASCDVINPNALNQSQQRLFSSMLFLKNIVIFIESKYFTNQRCFYFISIFFIRLHAYFVNPQREIFFHSIVRYELVKKDRTLFTVLQVKSNLYLKNIH